MVFEEIFKSWWQPIFRLCMGYFNDYETAQDMAQETFIIVWKQLPNFRNESSVGTWIFRIASNICLRHIDNDKRKTKHIQRGELPLDIKDEPQHDPEPQIQLLYKFISEMQEIDRIIIALELEDVKQAAIADIVGMSESNVRVRIHRIKEKLTRKFKENGQ